MSLVVDNTEVEYVVLVHDEKGIELETIICNGVEVFTSAMSVLKSGIKFDQSITSLSLSVYEE